MSWIKNILSNKVADPAIKRNDASPPEIKATNPILQYQSGVKYSIINGRITTPADNTLTFIQDGYSINDIIYSIVNLVCDKVRLPEWNLYKVVDEVGLKRYQWLLERKFGLTGKEQREMMRLKETSLQQISNYNLQQGKLANLLKNPNNYNSFGDLAAESSMFKMITGNFYWLGDMLASGANTGIPNSLEILPAQYIFIKVSDGFPARPVAYSLYNWSPSQEWTAAQILHDKYPNPNWNINGQQLYGMSPLKAALKNITRNNSSKDASTSKFQNGGLDEIIYFDDPRYTAEEGLQQAQALKIKLAEEYSGPFNQGKRAVSGMKTGVAQLGLSPVDLGIIDSERWDAIMFCNIYGVPPELLGLVNKTFNNAREAEKALTTRSAIPLINSIRNSFNRKIQTDWGFKGQNVYIDADLDCFQELKVDQAEVVNTTSKIMFLTPNEEREQLGWDARPEPEADELCVLGAGGVRVPLTDFQMTQVDAQLNAEAMRNAVNNPQPQQDGTNGTGAQANGSSGNTANGSGQARMSNGNGKNIHFAPSISGKTNGRV
ncbi:MAG TPA: phage portal protein [Gammaproteobacteria bacterium]|nr:phage portal protein [Gammaproteobacteria bacterium]